MRELGSGLSLRSFRDDLVYVEAALTAHPRTQPLADTVVRAIGEMEGAESKEREASRRQTRESARLAVADTELDARVMAFANSLLAATNQDRGSTLFKKFFPKEPPSVVVRLSFAEEMARVAGIVDELAKLPTGDPLVQHREPMRAASEALGAALEARRQAMATVVSLNADEAEQKERVNRLRFGLYAELQRIAADEGRSRKWADSFFRATPTRVAARDEEEPAVTNPPLPSTAVAPVAPAAPTAPVASPGTGQKTPGTPA